MNLVPRLYPGDCLLYSPVGFFGWVIATKTWHKVAHCEIYNGPLPDMRSWASRDGIGVNLYPFRDTQLAYVLRPRSIALDKARAWAKPLIGTKYGWLELMNFVGVKRSDGGMFCSQFLTLFYRAGGMNLFPEDDAARIAPFQFLDLVGEAFTLKYDAKGRP